MRLSLSTTPNIDPMKAKKETWKRPALECCARYRAAYRTTNVPTPVISVANNTLSPSRRNDSDNPRLGAQGTDTVTGPCIVISLNAYAKYNVSIAGKSERNWARRVPSWPIHPATGRKRKGDKIAATWSV